MLEVAVAIFVGVLVTVVGTLLVDWKTAGGIKRLVRRMRSLNAGAKKKRLIYISAGGTCRDPMAAAITKHMLQSQPNLDIDVEVDGMALGPITRREVSYAARQAIEQLLGTDYLRDHIPQRITPEDVESADLILVMDQSLLNLKTLPADKTYLLKEFFGQKGNIVDPWPDGRDAPTLGRYLETATELKHIIEGNFDTLLHALGQQTSTTSNGKPSSVSIDS